MKGIYKIAGVVAGLAVVVSGHPTPQEKREAAAPGGITDTDILQLSRARVSGGKRDELTQLYSALTLEHLESTFYSDGFKKFPDSDFLALGLQQSDVDDLKQIGQTEATHVKTLQTVLQAAGQTPVQPCTYNFGFTNAAGMVATARILEAVGISAYIGAAPLVNSSDILTAAATIVTVEARHQTFIRLASGAQPVPGAFDTPLGVRGVFTLAAAFIQSCPQGSSLPIQPFAALQVNNNVNITAGTTLSLMDPNQLQQLGGVAFCAFTGGDGTQFVGLAGGSCTVPNGLTGEIYLTLTKDGKTLSDDQVLAGSVFPPACVLGSPLTG
ncbi:hypothetical protein FGG08_005900 [Glutinoglossum americanum]|uniref:Uncharacterized protein n=1 Tax=Glutinoglossum americanum TaxID=1670608 RepID=A0A9P8HX79_9PEZI|nr:hypothetical protein FGG08_005900 [Glutinoglossum americanum]